jgi:succinyl-CoA synthetase beta subunit
MKVHEYQAKTMLKSYGIPVPRGQVARSTDEVSRVAEELGLSPLVLKAQIHAGGRGKGGGIHVVAHAEDVNKIAGELLGSNLVTPQTGPEGKPVNALLIEEALEVEREIYVGIVVDRSNACPVFLASSEGGVEIERVAAERPDKVIREPVNPSVGFRAFQANKIAYLLGLDPALAKKAARIFLNLYRLFVDKDCSLVEINPLVVTTARDLLPLDAKINLDDNALYRQKEMAELRDLSQEDPLEVEASGHNLNYIKLKGNVGCMVNGAGLAMTTMDLIKLVGAKPANFLDVGGGATVDMVSHGLRLLVSDPDVKVIFINIFGGILRCDTLAKGVTDAARDLNITVPIVVRMEGTNVDAGRQIMLDSGLEFTVGDNMGDAARKVAAALQAVSQG